MEVEFISTPSPGVWRHYKGNLYLVLGVGDYTGKHNIGFEEPRVAHTGFPENTKLVVYVGLYDNPRGNRICVRPVAEWGEILRDVEVAAVCICDHPTHHGTCRHEVRADGEQCGCNAETRKRYTGPRYVWVGP